MRTRFLHAADIHLGYEQYGNKERFNDFARAFFHIVDQAIAEQVEFVILAGDLFHKRAIDPPTLLQAIEGLDRLRSANIRAIGVEGNHEHAHYQSRVSWVEFLAERDLLILLNPEIIEGMPQLASWDGSYGAYTDLPSDVRVYGLKYYGASTPRVVEGLAKALERTNRPDYVILIMHAGLEGILPRFSATLTHQQIAPLRPHADYLALGHIHKPYEFDGWIYNPGSPETCSVTEAAWEDRGYYLVEVDTTHDPKHQAKRIRNQRRPFQRLVKDVDPYHDPTSLYDALRRYLAGEVKHSHDSQPVVELTLRGTLAFDRHDLDLRRIESLVKKAYDPLHVLVKDATRTIDFDAPPSSASRDEIEREVVRNLLERDIRFRSISTDWTELVLDLKRMALDEAPPRAIIDRLRSRAATLKSDPQGEAARREV